MTKEERLDWLCRLRSLLPAVAMPPKWRPQFNQALTEIIDEELKDMEIVNDQRISV